MPKLAETPRQLREYRSKMDSACEHLAMVFDSFGVKTPMDDDELVERAAKKIKTLHQMLLATGLSKGILQAVMVE